MYIYTYIWYSLGGGHNWKGMRQNDVELTKQSCEAMWGFVAAPVGKTCVGDPIAAHLV